VLGRRISVQTKLLGSAGLLVGLMVLVGVLAISKLSNVASASDTSYTHNTVPLAKLGEARALTEENRLLGVRYILEAAQRTELGAAIDASTAVVDRDLAAVRPVLNDPAERRAFDDIRRSLGAFRDARRTAFKRADRGDANAYAEWQADTAPPAKAAADAYAKLFTMAVDDSRRGNASIDATFRSARRTIIVALLVSLLAGLGIAYLIARGIRRNVAQVLDRLSSLRDNCATDLENSLIALRDGDLTVEVRPVTAPIESWSADELGDIAQATNAIRDKTVSQIDAYNDSRASLSNMIGQVAETAVSVSSASQQMASVSEESGRAVAEIANAVSDVATGSQRQVEGIDDARRLGEEVVEATGRSAGDAAATAIAADEARRIATEGASAVVEATEAMRSVRTASAEATDAIRQLDAKSEEIGGIVATITGIAEQTNLLALNAAIEAARAGEQGRGFAVVAEEVRKLAEESQQAAASIATLIDEIQRETTRAVDTVDDAATRTEQGAGTVEQAREAFARIGSSVDDVTARVGQIAAAVEQIAASSQRMGEKVAEVAAVAEEASASTEEVSASTEQTSASTQEIAASAQQLAANAADLERLVGQFRR